ncbi:MAG TPA: hypothetical protein VMG60_24890 [Burkholderiaceae bacterium]|nr:hypothetical protein [Burkholderiaceae bacterium]
MGSDRVVHVAINFAGTAYTCATLSVLVIGFALVTPEPDTPAKAEAITAFPFTPAFLLRARNAPCGLVEARSVLDAITS